MNPGDKSQRRDYFLNMTSDAWLHRNCYTEWTLEEFRVSHWVLPFLTPVVYMICVSVALRAFWSTEITASKGSITPLGLGSIFALSFGKPRLPRGKSAAAKARDAYSNVQIQVAPTANSASIESS